MKILKPDSALPSDPLVQFDKEPFVINGPYIFLAGSIEQNTAENWQVKFENKFTHHSGIIFNPRRDNWNSDLEQSIDNPDFVHQVNWELDALEKAHIIVMYIDPNTKSPITLLEFGKYYDSGKLLIACPKGFWRRGNIEVMCKRQGLILIESLDELFVRVESILPIYNVLSIR